VVNGRQIRNLTRLAKILHPDGQATLAQMRAVLCHSPAWEAPAPGVEARQRTDLPENVSSGMATGPAGPSGPAIPAAAAVADEPTSRDTGQSKGTGLSLIC
jgi:hypothetical protein